MRVLITSIGTSPMAVINSVWAITSTKKWVPEKIILIHDTKNIQFIETIKKILAKIVVFSGGHTEFNEILFSEDDVNSIKEAYLEAVKKESVDGNEIALDITPGRKSMVALAMYAGLIGEKKASKIFYLHLDDIERHKEKPFPLIPFGYVTVQDILEPGRDF